MKRKLTMLQPRVRVMGSIIEEKLRSGVKTLKQRQGETGRTLALNGAAWRRLRESVLREHPLCRHCLAMGLMVPATDVDHRDNDPTNNDRSNLDALCHECHSRKTAGDMGKRINHGCDTDGAPLDPAHPWNVRSTGRQG